VIEEAGHNAIGWRCAVCGTEVDIGTALPWRCPKATMTDRHHVLEIVRRAAPMCRTDDPNSLVAFGAELAWQAFAAANGMTVDACDALVHQLDRRVAAIGVPPGAAGTGFRWTPFCRADELSDALGFSADGGVWVKDETGQVAGSHKARQLASILLHLKAAELLGVGPRDARLAIASCGNAALAAAVLAAADQRELEVFVPPTAPAAVADGLHRLRAIVTECPRRPDMPPGDPCVHRFREAVAAGAIPFSVQGPENALCLDSGRTIGWEMAATADPRIDRVFVQVGGGALAACVGRSFAEAGVPARLHAVQTEGCAPLARAWERATRIGLADAPSHWDECMWPWESEPHSAADGIVDDETYDWIGVIEAMEGGGSPVVVAERLVVEAHELGRSATGIAASATGTAGLAGLLAMRAEVGDDERVAVIFSGVER
jgi:threonine dehydratase